MKITTDQRDTIERAIILLEDNKEIVDDGNLFKGGEIAIELHDVLLHLVEDEL
jgi:hypothetical protein